MEVAGEELGALASPKGQLPQSLPTCQHHTQEGLAVPLLTALSQLSLGPLDAHGTRCRLMPWLWHTRMP